MTLTAVPPSFACVHRDGSGLTSTRTTKMIKLSTMLQVTVDVELNGHWTDTITHWKDLHKREAVVH